MSEGELDQVIPIETARAEFRDSYPVQKKRTYGACRHRRFTVDPETGTVECRSCDERVDPIRALERVCRWFGEYERTLEAIEDYRKRVGRRSTYHEVPAVLDGQVHLAVTRSTGRLHAVVEVDAGAPILACGTEANVGIVDTHLRRDLVVGALRYGYGCSRCLKAVDEDPDHA